MDELSFFICGAAIVGILLLIFIISTLTRLSTQNDLIGELRKDLKKLRNEMLGEKDRIKSEMGERFDEAKDSVDKATAATITPEASVLEPEPEPQSVPESTESAADWKKVSTLNIDSLGKEEAAESQATPPPLPPKSQLASDRAAIKLTPDEPAPVAQKSVSGTEPKPKPIPLRQPPEPVGLGKLQQLLEKIKLWPPSGDTAAEATIGAWWATRIGLIVAIIAAVFGGIYVAEGAQPWMRVLAMIGVSVGVVILGLWLEKRVFAFGRLISAGGLGLGYFTAFAAFALEPMKIITSPEIGLIVQSAMIAVMVGWSFWKRDEIVAGMAILLGYVTCWFSLQNDEMNFVVTGLLLLAVAASFMLWRKGWLWSQGIAVVGTWLGFFILGVSEWSETDAPAFGVLLACLAGALVIFEAGHFFAARNFSTQQGLVDDSTGSSRKKWLRRVSVLASSLSIFAGFVTINETYPDLKEWFFLTFAVIMLVFSLVHYFRKNDLSRGIDQMFFLKATGLLCLFFVAKFEGPVRWLSIAAQAGVVLWTWRRTGYRWVEAAFAILFFVAIGVQIHGVLETDFDVTPWQFFSVQNIVGVAALVALSFWLTLHRLWRFPDPENPAPFDSPYNPAYTIGAALIAISAAVLALNPWSGDDVYRPIFLIIVGLAIASPLLRWAKAGPFLAATGAICTGFAHQLVFSGEMDREVATPAILSSAVLAILIAILCRRGWQAHWQAGNFFRLIYSSFAVALLVRAMERVSGMPSMVSGIEILALLAIAAAGVGILWENSRKIREGHVSHSPRTHQACQWILSIFIGLAVVIFAVDKLDGGNPSFGGVWLALAAAILLSAAFFVRSFIPVAAGGIPLVVSALLYLTEFSRTTNQSVHLIATGSMIAIFVTILLVLWRFTREKKSEQLRFFEVVLMGSITLFFHWGLRPFFDASEVLAADSALALGLLFVSRKWPMRALKPASAFPIGLVILHVFVLAAGSYEAGPRFWWWVSAALMVVWTWLYHQGEKIQLPRISAPAPDSKIVFGWPVMLTTAVFWIVSFYGVTEPWTPVAFTGFAIVVLLMWRFCGAAGGHLWTWFLLASAAVFSVLTIFDSTPPDGSALASVLITSGLIIFHGTLFPRAVEEFRNLTIFHALPALGLTFWACSPDVLGVDKLTTVCWGVASIVIFITGLIAGLKTYRIVGLVGLGLCVGRMFIVDIDDTLYRIIAFFAVAVVLLIIGFLYHRFRDRIENQFSGKTP